MGRFVNPATKLTINDDDCMSVKAAFSREITGKQVSTNRVKFSSQETDKICTIDWKHILHFQLT